VVVLIWNRIECFGGVNDGVKGNLWQEIDGVTELNLMALQRGYRSETTV